MLDPRAHSAGNPGTAAWSSLPLRVLLAAALAAGAAGLAGCTGSGSHATGGNATGANGMTMGATGMFSADKLRGALLTRVNGVAPAGKAQSGSYSSLPEVRQAAKAMAALLVTPKGCGQSVSVGGTGLDGVLGSAPAAVVTFQVGANGVSEVLAAPADSAAAAALGTQVRAGCAHYRATSSGKTYQYTVAQSSGDRDRQAGPPAERQPGGAGPRRRVVAGLPRRRLRRRHHGRGAERVRVRRAPARPAGLRLRRQDPAHVAGRPLSENCPCRSRARLGSMTEASPLFRPVLGTFPSYRPGKAPVAAPGQGQAHKLSSNESPYGPLPSVTEVIAEAARGINRYPDNGAAGADRRDRGAVRGPRRARGGRVRVGRGAQAAHRGGGRARRRGRLRMAVVRGLPAAGGPGGSHLRAGAAAG